MAIVDDDAAFDAVWAPRAELDAKQARIDELLRDFRRLTAEVPYAEERDLACILIAEVGTLRARVAELEASNAELRKQLGPQSLTTAPGVAMLPSCP